MIAVVETQSTDRWLAELYRGHYRELVRLAALLLGDVATSEEVVQDAFVRVHLARGRLQDEAKALAYLRSAVLNGARSAIRKREVRRRPLRVVTGPARSPEGDAIADDEHRRMVAALRSLPARQRECLALRYYLDLSEAEIAAALGISAGSVKTHASRGLAALAKQLEGEDRR
ncbi:MAG: SigE family RNA polymerase sigma factor [Actinomycetota bacterium]